MGSQDQKYESDERLESQLSYQPDLERLRTKGGHVDNRDQPALPVVHRSFANPAPLGLLSFATGVFLLSMLGVHARGITEPNMVVGVMIFFGGICQFISGIMEFVAGNTVRNYAKASLNLEICLMIFFKKVWSYSIPILWSFELELRNEYEYLYPYNHNPWYQWIKLT